MAGRVRYLRCTRLRRSCWSRIFIRKTCRCSRPSGRRLAGTAAGGTRPGAGPVPRGAWQPVCAVCRCRDGGSCAGGAAGNADRARLAVRSGIDSDQLEREFGAVGTQASGRERAGVAGRNVHGGVADAGNSGRQVRVRATEFCAVAGSEEARRLRLALVECEDVGKRGYLGDAAGCRRPSFLVWPGKLGYWIAVSVSLRRKRTRRWELLSKRT